MLAGEGMTTSTQPEPTPIRDVHAENDAAASRPNAGVSIVVRMSGRQIMEWARLRAEEANRSA
jgi:hypothetical protein